LPALSSPSPGNAHRILGTWVFFLFSDNPSLSKFIGLSRLKDGSFCLWSGSTLLFSFQPWWGAACHSGQIFMNLHEVKRLEPLERLSISLGPPGCLYDQIVKSDRYDQHGMAHGYRRRRISIGRNRKHSPGSSQALDFKANPFLKSYETFPSSRMKSCRPAPLFKGRSVSIFSALQ